MAVKRYGPWFIQTEDGIIFRKDFDSQSREILRKYGHKTMLIAHFIPDRTILCPSGRWRW